MITYGEPTRRAHDWSAAKPADCTHHSGGRMTRKRLGILIAGLGLAAALTLAVLPLSYAATQTGQSVSCGLAILPKNPTPPPGSNDECDAAHVRQWSWVGGVALGLGSFRAARLAQAGIRGAGRASAWRLASVRPTYAEAQPGHAGKHDRAIPMKFVFGSALSLRARRLHAGSYQKDRDLSRSFVTSKLTHY